jgi:LysR family transcriptional activator of nhaA
MEWLNYHHLLYFWTVARAGSVTSASKQLRLAQPTVSRQIRQLEEALGEQLFARRAGRLELTEIGRVVFRHADEIFSIGRKLLDTVRAGRGPQPPLLLVGVADVVPKLVAYHILKPALVLPRPPRIVCNEGKPERLLADLAVDALDVVIADSPVTGTTLVRAFNHLLGECGVTFFAPAGRAAALKRRFPRSLDGEPMLLPGEGTNLRRSLSRWFEAESIRPLVAAEFEDSALLKAFGQGGAGVFAAPTVIEGEVGRQCGVRAIGRTDAVRERFYAISVERRIKHPAVAVISDRARHELFALAKPERG